MDYRHFYNLESYLSETVRTRYIKKGYLLPFDFFCIIIWKANRAKSKVAKKLLEHGYDNLCDATKSLTKGLKQQANAKSRLRYLMKTWGFGLPIASAILAILYPDEFTVYDVRVCDSLGNFHNLRNRTNFEKLWEGYISFKHDVERSANMYQTFRDKDHYLWGKSFYEQLVNDIDRSFGIL